MTSHQECPAIPDVLDAGSLSRDKGNPRLPLALTNSRQIQHWTQDLAARLDAHARGTGARLIEVITRAGLAFKLARTWPGGRDRERQLKNQGGASRRCPECGVTPRSDAGVREQAAVMKQPETREGAQAQDPSQSSGPAHPAWVHAQLAATADPLGHVGQEG